MKGGSGTNQKNLVCSLKAPLSLPGIIGMRLIGRTDERPVETSRKGNFERLPLQVLNREEERTLNAPKETKKKSLGGLRIKGPPTKQDTVEKTKGHLHLDTSSAEYRWARNAVSEAAMCPRMRAERMIVSGGRRGKEKKYRIGLEEDEQEPKDRGGSGSKRANNGEERRATLQVVPPRRSRGQGRQRNNGRSEDKLILWRVREVSGSRPPPGDGAYCPLLGRGATENDAGRPSPCCAGGRRVECTTGTLKSLKFPMDDGLVKGTLDPHGVRKKVVPDRSGGPGRRGRGSRRPT